MRVKWTKWKFVFSSFNCLYNLTKHKSIVLFSIFPIRLFFLRYVLLNQYSREICIIYFRKYIILIWSRLWITKKKIIKEKWIIKEMKKWKKETKEMKDYFLRCMWCIDPKIGKTMYLSEVQSDSISSWK